MSPWPRSVGWPTWFEPEDLDLLPPACAFLVDGRILNRTEGGTAPLTASFPNPALAQSVSKASSSHPRCPRSAAESQGFSLAPPSPLFPVCTVREEPDTRTCKSVRTCKTFVQDKSKTEGFAYDSHSRQSHFGCYATRSVLRQRSDTPDHL